MAATIINLTHNIKEVGQDFRNRMTAGNFRFAVAKSLTNLAQLAQEEVKRQMPHRFIMRRNWISQGVRIKTASKSSLWSAVYSVDSGGRRPFMTRQEYGGIKAPESGQHIAIPMKAVQPNKRALIRGDLKPKALLGTVVQVPNAKRGVTSYRQAGIRKERKLKGQRQRVWVSTSSPFKTLKVQGKRPGQQWILIRQGKKYVPAWLLKPTAKIKQTNFLITPTRGMVMQNISRVLKDNLEKVLLSARPSP